MVTETQKDLIMLLKSCGLNEDTTVSVVGLCKTDENRDKLIEAIIDRYDQKGNVTEQDILKMVVMLVGQLKSATNQT